MAAVFSLKIKDAYSIAVKVGTLGGGTGQREEGGEGIGRSTCLIEFWCNRYREFKKAGWACPVPGPRPADPIHNHGFIMIF